MQSYAVILSVLLCIAVPTSYAHPDFVSAKIQWQNHTEIPHSINVIKKTTQNDVEYEPFTEEWFYQNLVLFLGITVIGIMIPVTILTYREEIFH